MSLKLAENSSLNAMTVGLCDTQIGGFSPILSNNTHRKMRKKKSLKKSADFFGRKRLFLVGDKSFGVTYALLLRVCYHADSTVDGYP